MKQNLYAKTIKETTFDNIPESIHHTAEPDHQYSPEKDMAHSPIDHQDELPSLRNFMNEFKIMKKLFTSFTHKMKSQDAKIIELS